MTAAMKTEHIAECFDNALEKLTQKNAEVSVCSKCFTYPPI